MMDLSGIDMSVALFGTTWETPLFLDPVGSQRDGLNSAYIMWLAPCKLVAG